MKYLVVIIAALLLALTLTAPVCAYDPPGQDTTDNATDVVIWHGDTLNISGSQVLQGSLYITENGTIVITGPVTLDGELNITVDDELTIAGLGDFFAEIITLIIIIMFAILGYWHRDKIMLIAAGFAFAIYGFTLWDTIWWLSILAVLVGIYLIIKAFWDERGNAKNS